MSGFAWKKLPMCALRLSCVLGFSGNHSAVAACQAASAPLSFHLPDRSEQLKATYTLRSFSLQQISTSTYCCHGSFVLSVKESTLHEMSAQPGFSGSPGFAVGVFIATPIVVDSPS